MSYPRSLPPLNESRRPPLVAPSQAFQSNDAPMNGVNRPSSYSGFSPLAMENRQRLMSSSNPLSPRQYEYRGESRSRLHPSIYSRNCSPNSQYVNMDENQNPIHDEAVQFVSSTRMTTHNESKKNAIEFVYEHFRCPVCLDVLIEATGIRCGHIFCRHCIENWSATKSTCPVCGEDVSSVGLKLYDIDNAIDSVAFHLSEEWRTRRALLETINQSQHSTENESSFDFTKYFQEGFFQPRLRFLKSFVSSATTMLSQLCEWVRENISLEGFAIRVAITCVAIIIFFFMSDRIIDFSQYMYLTLTRYEGNASLERKLGLKRRNAGPLTYQEFYGPDNTVFVRFIKMFYAD